MNRTILDFLRALRLAIPPRNPGSPASQELLPWPGHASRYLPLAAMLATLGPIGVYIASSTVLPHSVAVLITLATHAGLTQARMARAAVQRFDGPPSPQEGARPSLGAAGLLALLLITLLRWETLANIEPDWLAVSLIGAVGISHAMAVLILASMPQRSRPAEAEPVSLLDALIALATAAVPAIVVRIWTGDTHPLTAGMLCALVASAVARQLGQTARPDGRLPAMIQQIAEVAALLGILGVLGPVTDLPPPDEDAP
jgi:cobalamin synthase